jgi:hypothetical protein
MMTIQQGFRSWSVSMWCLVALFALLSPLESPAAELTTAIGGPGGNPFSADCGEYGMLVGLTGRSGDRIDQVAGLCANVDPISLRWIGDPFPTNQFGGNGGSPYTLLCNRDEVLIGLDGQVATVVANLNITCAALTTSDDRKSLMTSRDGHRSIETGKDLSNRVNNVTAMCRDVTRQGDPKLSTNQSGYGTSYDYPPPSVIGHWIARSMLGRSGDLVDQIQLSCDMPLRQMTAYNIKLTPKNPGSVIEGTPLHFSWQASGIRPELTPPLIYGWELLDHTHTQGGRSSTPVPGLSIPSFPQPTSVSHSTCGQPSAGQWVWAGPCLSNFTSTTVNDVPPAQYELKVSVRAASGSYDSTSSVYFEVLANQLVSLTISPDTVRASSSTTGTVTMVGPAGPKGRTLYLYTSNPNLVPVPSSITVPGGSATGTFSLRPNSAPGSAGEVTISVSTKPPISAKFSTGVQGSIVPRGLEEPSKPDQNSQTTEVQPESDPTLAAAAQQSSGDTETTPQSEVGERGISPLQMARPSTGIQSTVVTPPAAPSPMMTLPPSQVGAAATQVKPSPQVVPGAAGTLSLPGDTKSAVLSVQLPFGTQLPGK